jgi:hypothetical protein
MSISSYTSEQNERRTFGRLDAMKFNSNILQWPYRRFRDFLGGGDWRALPAAIQKAMVRLWRAEQDEKRASLTQDVTDNPDRRMP